MVLQKKIAFGADHAGFELKQQLISFARKINIVPLDFGIFNQESCDYPDFAYKVTDSIINQEANLGVLICGSGIGMSIAANRVIGIRAALCYDNELVCLARAHDDANILCLGARFTPTDQAISLLRMFLETDFSNGRHCLRISKIDSLKI